MPGALAAAICDNVGSCCAADGRLFDPARCRAGVTDEYRWAVVQQGDGGAFDPAGAASCVDAVAADTRRCDLGKVDLGAHTCVEPHGRLGEPCKETCLEPDGVVCGPPVGPAVSDAGVPSHQVSCYINDGLYCGEGACRKQGDTGAACAADEQCHVGWCEGGLCVPPVAAGNDCSTHSCAEGLYCDSLALVCDTKKADGTDCRSPEECLSGNCDFSGGSGAVLPGDASPTDRGQCAPATPEVDSVFLAFVCGG